VAQSRSSSLMFSWARGHLGKATLCSTATSLKSKQEQQEQQERSSWTRGPSRFPVFLPFLLFLLVFLDVPANFRRSVRARRRSKREDQRRAVSLCLCGHFFQILTHDFVILQYLFPFFLCESFASFAPLR